MRYTVRPLSDHTWLRPDSQRQRSRFDSSWTQTKELLAREVDLLAGRDVVIEVDVRERDRYGATETGQQYTGFKALPGGTPLPAGPTAMSRREAAELIERLAIGEEGDLRERVIARILVGTEPPRTYREAKIIAHPDRRDGDHELAYQVDEALRVLGVQS